MNILKSTLGLALAAGLLAAGSATTALADGHGQDHGDRGSQNNQGYYGQPWAQTNDNDNDDDNGQGEHGDRGERGNAHNCTNPAGRDRGWCQHNRDNNQNGSGYGYGQNNSQLHGIITGVNGDQVRILQGLSTVSFDATNAIQRNSTNGSLYPTRSITAYGYWDRNHYFHANTIR